MSFKKWLENKDDFAKYHQTGHISSTAYKRYEEEGGLSWLGSKSKYPILLKKGKYGPYEVEFRQTGESLEYTKTDDEGWPVYGPDKKALMLTPEEIKAKGYRQTDATIVAFIDDKPIGFASNEWGAVGVWVEGKYQKLGIGSDLLVMYMQDNPKFITGERKIGQMTPAGYNMTTAAYDKLEKQYGKDWFKPSFKEWLNETRQYRKLTPEEHETIIDLLTDPSTEEKALSLHTTVSGYIAKILGMTHKNVIKKLMEKYGIQEPITLSRLMKRKNQDPVFAARSKAAVSSATKEIWADPEKRVGRLKSLLAAGRKRWQDPEQKTVLAAKMSELSKKRWADPEFKANLSAKLSAINKKPEAIARRVEQNKKLWADPEFRANFSATMEKLWDDPEFKNKKSEIAKKLWTDPEYRDKTMQNNPMITDFWNHLATFPPEKQRQILTAIGTFYKLKRRSR
jgi:hypothetical protein